jgi:Uncharacterized protein conserved in bacteria
MNWKKIFVTIAAFLLCWINASLHAAEPARLPFYEAQNGNVRLYILGTFHIGQANVPLRQEITQALSRSSQLIMELSAEELSRIESLLPSIFCRDACLRRQTSSTVFTKIISSLPGKTVILERIPAWLISAMLVVNDASKLGLSPEWGTEEKLIKAWGNRPTLGLETAEEQLGNMTSLDDSIQREMLEGYLMLPEEKRMALIQKLYQIWQDGDTEALLGFYQEMNEGQNLSSDTVQKSDEKLIYSRNKRFIERLQPFLTPDEPVFMAVGALHLGGDQGILALLRARGFKITAR